MNIPQIPFKQDDKITLTGPVFMSCGCGNVTARWATVQQNLVTRLPQVKPKASRIASDWLTQEGLREKYPILKAHQFGVVVAETDKGFEIINVMDGATMKVAQQIADLIKRSKEWTESQSNN